MLTLKDETMLGSIPSDWESKPLVALLNEHYPGDWGSENGLHFVKVLRSTNLTNDGKLDLSDIAIRALKPSQTFCICYAQIVSLIVAILAGFCTVSIKHKEFSG